jgi:hypothetical protein
MAPVRRPPTIEEVLQKVALRQPLTDEEQKMYLAHTGDNGTNVPFKGLDKGGLSSLEDMDGAAEKQLTPDEMKQMMSLVAAPEKEAEIDRRLKRADALRNATLPERGAIRMSSGTMYQPANNWGEVLGTLAQQAAGNYQTRKAERMADRLRQKQEGARKTYLDRVGSKPRTQMELDMLTNIQNDMGQYKPPQYDLGKTSIWDKLRSYF